MEEKKEESGGGDRWARWNALLAAAAKTHTDKQTEEEAKKNAGMLKILKRNLNLFTSGKILNTYEGERLNVGEPLPGAFRSKIRALGGSEESIILVLEKVLTKSDVDFRQCRLLIPFTQVKNHAFLSEGEKGVLESGDKISGVMLIDPDCDVEEMDLTKWNAKRRMRSYLLVRNWSRVVRKNGLNAEDCVQLWGFRRGLQLGFALVRIFNSST